MTTSIGSLCAMPQRIALINPVAAMIVLSGLLARGVSAEQPASAPTPLTRVHAHNDYEHKRPLFDALDQGFCSVEADIYFADGKLLVGHTRRSLRPDRTLQALYLDPLKQRVAANGGRIYKGGPPVTLFIDFKTAGPKTYAALRPVLDEYRDMISSYSPNGVQRRAIDVVITGNCPRAEIEADKERRVGIDGNVHDLDSDQPADLIPVVSENWRTFFKWRGKGPMPVAEHEKLLSFVKKAHEHGRRLRLWATPDNLATWKVLYAANVDLINTDDLAGAAQFLRNSQSEPVTTPSR
jgi:hypothetical protein